MDYNNAFEAAEALNKALEKTGIDKRAGRYALHDALVELSVLNSEKDAGSWDDSIQSAAVALDGNDDLSIDMIKDLYKSCHEERQKQSASSGSSGPTNKELIRSLEDRIGSLERKIDSLLEQQGTEAAAE